MPTKRNQKKMTRQKKLIKTVTPIRAAGSSLGSSSTRGHEEAIVRKFHQIQKGYTRLMSDVAKELDLVKDWISSQAMTKREDIKTRLNTRLSRS